MIRLMDMEELRAAGIVDGNGYVPSAEVRYTSGPYVCRVDDWQELWRAVWMFVGFAVYMREHGRCTCGCKIMACDYCAEECLDEWSQQ